MPLTNSRGAGDGGAGGGFRFRVPRDVFAGANRAAAIVARNAGLDAGDLAEFDADPSLLVILSVGDVDTYQARRAMQWRDVANVAPGQPGRDGAGAVARTLRVRMTNDDRSSYDASADYTVERPFDDFFIATTATDAHSTVELTVQAGREIYAIYWDSIEVFGTDTTRVGATQTWLLPIGGEGGVALWVRTRAAA